MCNKFIITGCDIQLNRIEYSYEIQGEWKKCFNEESPFFVEYNEEIEIPKSIAMIPLIANLLPVSWLYDGDIIVEEIDEDFFGCIEDVKAGYKNMYKQVEFKGKVVAGKKVKNFLQGNDSAMMFSGGVDAFNTLITHINERPRLLTVHGADVRLDDSKGWKQVENQVDETKNMFNLNSTMVASNFRIFIKEDILHTYTMQVANEGWWHGFHHMLGLVGLVAPITYMHGCSKLYIASSFCAEDKDEYTCASDPTTDNYVRFCGAQLIHDGYELNRQRKVNNIVDFTKQKKITLPIHVCWESTGGGNCCWCEKCIRTIMEIVIAGGDPTDYGFYYDSLKKVVKHLRRMTPEIPLALYRYYIQSQKELRNRVKYKECPKELRWFYRVEFNSSIHRMERNLRKKYHMIKRKLCR